MNDLAAAKQPRAKARRGPDSRVDQQPGFVLHSYPWRETSLILEVFTRDHGRTAMVARGAKRPTSQFRGLVSPFCPLAVSWSGRNEVKSLVRAEWTGGMLPLRGDALLAAFYVNELLVRLLARGDAHERLFDSYREVLCRLADSSTADEGALRDFELDLLRDIGYEVPLDLCADGEPIVAGARYAFRGEGGAHRTTGDVHDQEILISGRSLLAMAERNFADGETASECKAVLRQVIRQHLGGKPLNTRRILVDLKQL